jgi:cell division GTPase FtsZ
VIDNSLQEEVQVTVIATGFGGRGGRRARRRETAPEAPLPASAASEGFDVSRDVLDVPSFLRDD